MGEGDTEPLTFTGEAAEWLRERAEENDIPPEEYATRLVTAFRTAESTADADYASVEDVDALDARVDALNADFDEKLADVRERVVQVKREADEKADVDHVHDELAADVSEALAATRTVEETASRVEDIADRLDAGFENYEDILERLRDRTDTLADRLGKIARVLVDIRESTIRLAESENRRTSTETLKREANREGVREAACADCRATVDVALLTRPACPFCEATFTGVEPKSSFFGSATLAVGTRPALEAPPVADDPVSDLEAFADE